MSTVLDDIIVGVREDLAARVQQVPLALTGVLAGCSSADSDHKIRIGIKVDQPGLGYQDGNT